MATNTPAKTPNVKRYEVANDAETQIDFEGAVGIIGFRLQDVGANNIRASFDANGTFSTDNYYTVKSGTEWIERDINWVHAQLLWVRSEGAATIVEVLYWA